MTTCLYGFRIMGALTEERRLVDAGAAFLGYCACDTKAEVNRESYLSAFTFPGEFAEHLHATGSTRGYGGPCGAPWLWWDVDREADLNAALVDSRRLALALVERFKIREEDLLIFHSGSKGFHLGAPTMLWGPEPSANFNRVARRFAEHVAVAVAVLVDAGVYDKVRAFRAPNSKHPKTGRHKRRLAFDELQGLSIARVLELAESPEPFDLPTPTGRSEQAAAAWLDATRQVEQEDEGKGQRRASGEGPGLNRGTLGFIRDGATEGDRHRLLFSAAANLGEFNCPPALAYALLTEAALDSGLSPKDARRQIDCGLAYVGPAACPLPASSPAEAPSSSPEYGQAPTSPKADDLAAALAALWGNAAPAEKPMPSGAREEFSDRQQPGPSPPPGARLFFQDSRSRACSPGEAAAWTWERAPSWYSVAEHPIPTAFGKGGES